MTQNVYVYTYVSMYMYMYISTYLYIYISIYLYTPLCLLVRSLFASQPYPLHRVFFVFDKETEDQDM